MEFKKREEYSIDKEGFLFQISQDEFVHCSDCFDTSIPKVITWMKGNKCTKQQFAFDNLFGVVGNSFFFKENKVIKKAELRNDKIVIIDSAKIENGIRVLFSMNCLHYFVERDNNPKVLFAIPINEDYRTKNGIKFNISIDELGKGYDIHVYDNFLFCIKKRLNSSFIRRYQFDSEKYLEKKELPMICRRLVIFNNWIFYLNWKGDLISVNMNNFSYEIMKSNLEEVSNIVGIDENGMVNVQTEFDTSPVYLFTAKLREKYMYRANMPKLINTNIVEEHKRIFETEKKEKEELERKLRQLEGNLQTDQKEKEELLKTKNLLENGQKNRYELERRLEDKEKKEEEQERRLQTVQKEKEELLKTNNLLGKRLENEENYRNELERRLEEKEKEEKEQERRLQTVQKEKEELLKTNNLLGKRLENEEKYTNELERRLEEKEKEEKEQERRLQTEQKEKEELIKTKNLLKRRLENEETNKNELERRLEEKEKKEEELEKRNVIMGEEMKDLKLKYNKLLVRVSY